MRFFTAHTRADARAAGEPVLLVEGFRWGAFLFGPLWLAWYRAYIPAALAMAASVAVFVLTGGAVRGVMLAAIAFLVGLTGNDCRRWSLERRGYLLTDVVAARDAEAAFARFLARRPEQAERLAR